MAPFTLAARLALTLVLALAAQCARADTPISLFQSFVGNVNFVGTQVTVRERKNNKPCQVLDPTEDRTAILSGIPQNATILSAQLYWAASNLNPDFTVIFDGASVTATEQRSYYSTTIGNNFNYYSGAADVTAQVKKKLNATYSFRGLTVDNNSPYCSVEAVLGGFALLVIYSHPDQPFRMLNLYEGFQYMRYSGIALSMSGFRIPNPIGSATGRVAHITWEGDSTLDGSGENLTFNGYEMTDSTNPSGNQFNSKSSINGDPVSYGIDFDAYTVSSPVIKSGQTTASTSYESGQDLVLLSAEVVALPNVPMSDLSIAMQRGQEMALGQNVSYTMTVSNKGPSTETGPTVITSTLPPGLAFVSGSGTGWSCTSSGQSVTCTNAASLPGGSSLSNLVLTATVVAGGTITTSATVSGKQFDPVAGNNTASDTGTVSDGSLKYVFTDKACKKDLKVDSSAEQCSTTLAPGVAGAERVIFITAVSDNVPIDRGTLTESLQFAMRCVNPAAPNGVVATVAGQALPPCAIKAETEPGAWSAAASVKFESFSSGVRFSYADVGKVQLFLRPASTQKVSAGGALISIPSEVRIIDVKRDDGAKVPSGLADSDAFTMKAGANFSVRVGAFTTGGVLAPNFGREDEPARFLPPAVSIGASSPAGKAAMLHDEGAPAHEDPYELPALGGQFNAPVNGEASANFTWQEVGIINLTPGIAESSYLGVKLDGLIAKPVLAGRFIPHHFQTDTSQRMPCTVRMSCIPSGVASAAYSKEKFPVKVTARSASGAQTMNYRGAFARDVVLSAWDKPGGVQQKTALDPSVAAQDQFVDGVATVTPFYTLANGFSNASPQGPWGAPESIFLRAVETGGAVSSLHATNAASSLEAGIRIVNGRLLVPHVHGSERLPLPMPLSAQYWTGSNWELSNTDKHNVIDPDPAKVSFSSITLAGMLSLAPQGQQLFASGTAKFFVKVNPAKAGNAELVVNQMDWLPSTKGRLKFGTYKSPLIYLRELH